MKVLLLAPYPLRTTPSQRFRFEQYLSLLAEEGISIDVRPFLTPPAIRILHRPGHIAAKIAAVLGGSLRRLRDLLSAARYDLVFIHREAFPLGHPWIERILDVIGRPYVFDFDDAIYLSRTSEANRLWTRLKCAGKTAEIVRRARLVIAGNTHLARWAGEINPNVVLISTTIDTDSYRPRESSREGPLCIGWSGSVTTVPYLRTIEGVLRDVQRQYGVRLRVIGDAGCRLEGAEVEALPWCEKTEVADLQEIDIGVMPVVDEEWALGKAGLKGMQYMALGIPTIMSPVGSGAEVAEGGAAVLAATPQDWHDSLVRLIRDESERRALGEAGRRRVVERYSVRANLPRYREALLSCL